MPYKVVNLALKPYNPVVSTTISVYLSGGGEGGSIQARLSPRNDYLPAPESRDIKKVLTTT